MFHRSGDPIREGFERGLLDFVYYQEETDTIQADVKSKMNTMPVQQGTSEANKMTNPNLSIFENLKWTSEENQVVNKQLSIFVGTLNNMRDKNDFTDVTLTCEKQTFKAHKVILCANSPYFLKMFSSELDEAKSGKVTLRGIDPESLKIILSVIYFRPFQTMFSTEQLKSLLAASHMLQFSSLFDYCCDQYMKKLDHSTFLDIWNTAELYENEKMLKLIPNELVKRFNMVKTTKDFLSLTVGQLSILVLALKTDEHCADDILKSILEWIKYDETTRTQYLSKLLCMVDLKLITTEYLSTLLQSESILKNCIDVTTQVMAAAAARLSDLTIRSEDTQATFAVVGIRSTPHVGGIPHFGGIPKLNIQYYDMAKKSWSAVVNLPLKYDQHDFVLVILKDKLYCITTADPRSFDLSRSAQIVEQCLKFGHPHRTCCTLLENRFSPGAAALNDDIYVVGGIANNGDRLRSVERYNVTNSQLHRISPMQKPHCSQAVVTSSSYVYVAEVKDSNIYIEHYDPKIDQWHAVELKDGGQGFTGSIMREHNIATCAEKLFLLLNNKLYLYKPKSCTCQQLEFNRFFEAIWGMSNPKHEYPFIIVLTTDNELYQYWFSNKHFTKLPKPNIKRRIYCALTA